MAGEGSPDLKVNYANVQTIADSIRKIAKDILLDLERMDVAVKVVADTWDGEAHAKYLALQREYKSRAHHMNQTLERVARTIEQGKESYLATDRKASGFFDVAY